MRWVYTDQPFLPVDSGNTFVNRIWESDDVSDTITGMLPVPLNNYAQDERWRLPAGMKPGHMCHPEWFASGEPYPNDLPPTEYGYWKIPTCCGVFNPFAQGGAELGGEVAAVVTYATTTTGGFEIGGLVPTSAAFVVPTEGGVELGGEVAATITYTLSTEGGVELGGEVAATIAYTLSTEGGVELGGEVPEEYTPPNPPSIRAAVAGNTPDQNSLAYPTRSAGDVLLVFLSTGVASPAANSGWTRIAMTANPGNTNWIACYWKVSDGTDTTKPFTATFMSNAGYVSVSVLAATTVDVSGAANGTGTNLVAPSVTTTVADTVLFCGFAAGANFAPPPAIAPPGSMNTTGSAPWSVGPYFAQLIVCDETLTASGATGTRTATSAIAPGWDANTVAVRA